MKVRLIEPGNRPYKPTPLNHFVYDRYIRTPSVGLNTLATIIKQQVEDTLMYSESIARLVVNDILDADLILIGIFTFNENEAWLCAGAVFSEEQQGRNCAGRAACFDELPGGRTLLRLCTAGRRR